MIDLKFNESGTDAVYLGNANIFFPTLFSLSIFQHDWREDKLGSQSVLQGSLDFLGQKYQGGLTGNRYDIAARKLARKEMNMRIRAILHYIALFADEKDIATLLSSGVVTSKKQTRARKSAKTVVAS